MKTITIIINNKLNKNNRKIIHQKHNEIQNIREKFSIFIRLGHFPGIVFFSHNIDMFQNI